MKRFVITAAPRSATQYAAAVLQALGVACPHEQSFRPQSTLADVLEWYAAGGGESSWLAWAFLPMLPGPVVVLHWRRDPWKVIDSLAHRNWQVIRNVESHTPNQERIGQVIRTYCPRVFSYADRVDRAAALVIDWNECIDHFCLARSYAVESLDAEAWAEILDLIEVARPRARIEGVLGTIGKAANAGRKMVCEPISDPLVADFIRQRFGGCPQAVHIEPATDRRTPEELAEQLDPRLLAEVNGYARRWNYRTVEPVPV